LAYIANRYHIILFYQNVNIVLVFQLTYSLFYLIWYFQNVIF